MKRKALRTFVQIVLLGLLLGTSSGAYADTISITSVSVSNLQLVPTFGTIVFLGPQVGSRTSASAVASNSAASGLFEESGDISQSPTRAEASASVTFAGAAGVSDFPNSFFSANTNVMLSGCQCTASTEGIASLRESFMIVGGSGNVDVNLSALLQTMQTLMTDQLSLFAASDASITLQLSGVDIFSFDSRLSVGPNSSLALETQRQLSQVLTLQFDQQYTLGVFVRDNSRGAQNAIPEPATVVLLVSGLGFMAGLVKKRRTGL